MSDYVEQEKIGSIAIVGMACRFPGANNYQQFWQNLKEEINSISEIPCERWEVEKYYSSNPEEQNKSISKWGGFIEGIDQFDAKFFGISPREAQRMDPQQRLMLELSWSCLEDAGYPPSQLSGSSVGVFIGACNYDYDLLQNGYQQYTNGHAGTGTWTCMIPNRISSFFNFRGPSIPVDTACSSSLVAIHQAINALKEQECNMALVGGVSIFCTPTRYIQMSQLRMLSPQGQCKAFDSEADGYVRGEGAGLILLKPLAKAIEDEDHIYGVIRGSAVNHGGRARSLTSPNVYGQAQVLCDAYTKANVLPNTISYIEAHGTGTPLGDPIEINGLKRAFRQLHQKYDLSSVDKPYCGLGTVKTNIGHLEGASGIAGIIKVVLAMKHKKLPKIVNFKQLNPRIKLENSPFYIVEETQEWQKLKTETGKDIPRRAGVSSFGIGGVNAHVILEEAPESAVSPHKADEHPLKILTITAKTKEALQDLAQNYQDFLQSPGSESLADICFTANTGRTHFQHRLAVTGVSRGELVEKLQSFLAGDRASGLITGKAKEESSKIAFLCTGQGCQSANMGKQLYLTQPTFRQAIDECDRLLRGELEQSLLSILYPENRDDRLIDRTAYTQPALFALEYALAQMWISWGIKPDGLVGHSLGEYVAATLAGVFSLAEALKLVTHRGRLMQQLPPNGEMRAVIASAETIQSTIEKYHLDKEIAIAAVNAPEAIVISGTTSAIATLTQTLTEAGIKTTKLQVSHAFHSPLMEPMLAEFRQIASQINYQQPKIELISNLTGDPVDREIATPEYWCDRIRQTVLFAPAIETLAEKGYELFVEIGPKPVLLGMARQSVPDDRQAKWLPSLRPGKEDWQQILETLAELYVAGVKVDWRSFEAYLPRNKVVLPTYPFQRQRYWVETSANASQKFAYSSCESQTPTIADWRKTPDPQQLAQQLEKTGKFSPEQVNLVSELLKISVQQDREKLAAKPAAPQTQIFTSLLKMSSSQRQEFLNSYLKNLISATLQMHPEQIQLIDSLLDLGIDSLMVVETINRIGRDLRLMLYAQELYKRPTIHSLARYLVSEFERTHIQVKSQQKQKLSFSTSIPFSPTSPPSSSVSMGKKLTGMAFILSSPRSGSNLLRIMLARHCSIFSPPELHLLPFNTMSERQPEVDISYLEDGLQRALRELKGIDSRASQELIKQLIADDVSIYEIYAMLKNLAGDRILVDKSTTYGMHRQTLERAEDLFENAKYIYLVRHPYAVIESFVRMRTDKLVDADRTDSYKVAEHIWANSNQNIRDFCKQIEQKRHHLIRYEDLVVQPEKLMKGLCEFLAIPFDPAILKPYEGARMTDGFHSSKSTSIGDSNFLQHKQIETALEQVENKIKLPHQLEDLAARVATSLDYQLPSKAKGPSSTTTMKEHFLKVRGLNLCLCSWGPEAGRLILCLHGLLDQGAAWSELAERLAQKGYWVVAPDLRGHGRSAHGGSQSSYSLLDFLADLDAIIEKLTYMPFTLIGHSLGSVIAALFASSRPQKVKELVLVETILQREVRFDETAEQIATHLDYLASPPKHHVFPNLATAAERLHKANPVLSESLAMKLAQRITEPCTGGLRWQWDPLLSTCIGVDINNLSRSQYLGLLKQIKVPTTLIYGDKSNFNQKEDLSEQQAAMPQAKRFFVPGGHNIHLEAASALAQIIINGLQEDNRRDGEIPKDDRRLAG
ncbi:MAG: alpha/beta fold hydrolase [Prochloraceae cyanobacterium]|nr:alpha/beta fold hydrolase [Prochloraceae cyanobacterium]